MIKMKFEISDSCIRLFSFKVHSVVQTLMDRLTKSVPVSTCSVLASCSALQSSQGRTVSAPTEARPRGPAGLCSQGVVEPEGSLASVASSPADKGQAGRDSHFLPDSRVLFAHICAREKEELPFPCILVASGAFHEDVSSGQCYQQMSSST